MFEAPVPKRSLYSLKTLSISLVAWRVSLVTTKPVSMENLDCLAEEQLLSLSLSISSHAESMTYLLPPVRDAVRQLTWILPYFR